MKPKSILARPFFPWVALFVGLNVVFPMVSNTNPYSRLALLFSLVENHEVSIDSYKNLTIDWAQAPNGRYYSNKAPGPSLVALPLFWLIDEAVTWRATNRLQRDMAREGLLNLYSSVVSLFVQVLPFAVFGFLLLSRFEAAGVSLPALHLMALGLFFGNTASLLMNSFFGHAFSAAMLLGSYYFLLEERFFWMGLTLGFAALGDYLCVLAVPVLLALSGKRGVVRVILGGLFPLVLWTLYHTAAFGSPFRTALQFENPEFKAAGAAAFGTVSLPSLSIVGELLFGKMRGLIWAMPWAFVVMAGLVRAKIPAAFRSLVWFIAISFPLWLLVNLSFNAWHSGQSPGPRYLSPILPFFALALGLCWDQWAKGVRSLAALGMLAALLLFIAFYAADANVIPVFMEMPAYYRQLIPSGLNQHLYREVGLFALFGFTALCIESNRPGDR